MSSTPEPVQALLVTASKEEAESLAEKLVERRLCACVNVVPGLTSVYRWEGEVTKDVEALMIIKTTASLAPAVRAFVEKEHSYDTPEVLALDIDAAHSSDKYVRWIGESVQDPRR